MTTFLPKVWRSISTLNFFNGEEEMESPLWQGKWKPSKLTTPPLVVRQGNGCGRKIRFISH